MSEEAEKAALEAAAKAEADQKAADNSQSHGATAQEKEVAALKSEAAANRVKAKELQEKLDKITADDKARIEDDAIKNGEAAELLKAQSGELEKQTGRADANEKALEGYLEVELEGASDDIKALMPEGTIAQKLAWVAKAKAAGLLKARKIANGVMDSGEEGDDSGVFSDEIKKCQTQQELDAVMKKYGKA